MVNIVVLLSLSNVVCNKVMFFLLGIVWYMDVIIGLVFLGNFCWLVIC